MNISLDGALSSYSFYTHSIKEKFLASLASVTPLQKKVALVATALLSCCAIIYFSYRSWKARKLEAEENDLPLGPHPVKDSKLPLTVQSDRKRGPQIASSVEGETKGEEKKDLQPGRNIISKALRENAVRARQQQNQERPKGFVITSAEVQIIPVKEGEGRGRYFYAKQVGSAACQGIRPRMEDADLAAHDVLQLKTGDYPFDVFGVFDGHGGPNCSQFVKSNLVKYLKNALERHNQEELTDEGIVQALGDCFPELDAAYATAHPKAKDGSTATVGLLLKNKVWVANVGDSRTILVKKNGEVIQASEDAKPSIPRFRDSIKKLGGAVVRDRDGSLRVQGQLGVARAIGDHHIRGKKGECCVSAEPEITCFDLEDVEYFVFACDGLFDAATTNETGEAVKAMNASKETPKNMARKLARQAIARGSEDNVSVVVVKL